MRSFRSFWGCRGINHSQDKLISRGEPATDHPGSDLWKGASPQWWVAKVLALVIGAVPIALPLVMQVLAVIIHRSLVVQTRSTSGHVMISDVPNSGSDRGGNPGFSI